MSDGYPPTHPWYWYLGGAAVEVGDIPAARIETGYNQMVPSRARANRQEQIIAAIVTAEEALVAAAARYGELVRDGDGAIGEYERGWDRAGECKALHTALALAYSHVSYYKGVLVRLKEFLGPGVAIKRNPTPVQMF